MPAYVIYQGEVTDPERYEEYKARAQVAIADAGGRYLARGGDVEVLEGDPPPGRIVILEFPTLADAVKWYRSDAYAEARQLREGATTAQLFAVDGIT